MSKIGEKAIEIPESVVVETEGRALRVKGKGGDVSFSIPRNIEVLRVDKSLVVKRKNEDKRTRSLHGLYRSILYNAVIGIDKPWEKRLEIVGTGYNVKLQGEDLVFKLGFSHPVVFEKVPGTIFKVEGNNKVIISGADKQLVGLVAQKIKKIKKPDAYKGKGIRYEGERLKLKPGKKAKTAGE